MGAILPSGSITGVIGESYTTFGSKRVHRYGVEKVLSKKLSLSQEEEEDIGWEF